MNGNHILASLSYFSIFFAPFLLPIIIYFVAEEEVKYHAKKALWTHFIPYVVVIIGFVISGAFGLSSANDGAVGIAVIATFVIAGIISIYYFIWNIVKGIQVLKAI
ncbi:DUF4870 domain-containing protein [Bacillus cytotoxicus]|uniref:DUF4870 domain-containing protein n=1 Tax=Bacillus cereus group sp. BfR-BA-01492 TaxID=2920361 RepID=UPI001F56A8E3|nr:DUF4870 domain-containing protein [Bacillus cereus group sp. BfR-BA-01492]EMA6344160.1 DUF4870 domain-containing protein [Bacillus cytotoxicus]